MNEYLKFTVLKENPCHQAPGVASALHQPHYPHTFRPCIHDIVDTEGNDPEIQKLMIETNFCFEPATFSEPKTWKHEWNDQLLRHVEVTPYTLWPAWDPCHRIRGWFSCLKRPLCRFLTGYT